MSYQVIARKWRPGDFDAVIFQDHVSRTIKNSIKSGRIHHAYLFAGPRGVGKTTMARILAKALNCVNGPTDSPCGVCENCVEIRDGSSFDVIEIDGASNRGIENIRELRENVNFAPLKSRYKVYIIDEVHMLTKEAFNALLKTLEEPPPHVVFVFATTEIHQVPETILSRCQKYFFKKIAIDAIARHLGYIAQKEGFTVDEKALYSVARAADGSMRDAQSLLDQVLSFAEGEIGEEDALAILGVVPIESYMKILTDIAGGDRKGVLIEVDRVVTLGVDIPRYAAGLIDVLRAVRLIKNGISVQELLGFSPEENGQLRNIAEMYSDEDIGALFATGKELLVSLRSAANERIYLEMALLDMAAAAQAPSVSALLRKIEELSEGGASTVEKKNRKPHNVITPPHDADAAAERPAEATANERQSAVSDDAIKRNWDEFIAQLRTTGAFLHAKLAHARVDVRDGRLSINYPAGQDTSYYSRILDRNDITFIKDALKKRMGQDIDVSIGRHDPVEEAELPVPGEDQSAPPPEAVMLKNPEVEEMEIVNPVVEKVKDLFQGKIINKGDE